MKAKLIGLAALILAALVCLAVWGFKASEYIELVGPASFVKNQGIALASMGYEVAQYQQLSPAPNPEIRMVMQRMWGQYFCNLVLY